MPNTIIVTRHPALVDLIRERYGLGRARVVEHATPADIAGQHVWGVLPLHLAVLAESVTEIPLALAPEDRGRELSLERLREVAGEAVTYVVRTPSALRAGGYETCLEDPPAGRPQGMRGR